jgi:mono/diheme cytochrome c family protein
LDHLRDTRLSIKENKMNKLFDIMLQEPLPHKWVQGLLFAAFFFHMLFVLLTIGTAIIAFFYFIHAWWSGKLKELRWDKEILRSFLAHKSLAVVLGVAPLLLMQVGFPVPFFNGIGIFAPYWMLIIVLLMVAFLSFDLLAQKISVHRYIHMLLGIIALTALLIVPGIFVLIIVTSENPDKWISIIQNGYHIDASLAIHWLLRYMHVIGAAVVFGAAFHYFYTTRDDRNKKPSLLKWIVIGILSQFIIGPMLTLSLPGGYDFDVYMFITIGIVTAAVLMWKIFSIQNTKFSLQLYIVVPLLMIILISMLLTRQQIQSRSFMSLIKSAQQNSYEYERVLNEYENEAKSKYKSDISIVYDNGKTIYARSCCFCHGINGDGKGEEEKNLSIPPEDIASIRATRDYLYEQIIRGVPGSAMPYFAVFDRDKLYSLISYLDENYNVLGLPEPVPVVISESALNKANQIYTETCSGCHGMDGKGSQLSVNFKPRPPDFTAYSLSPQRTLEIIDNGYHGTVMPAFGNLQEDVRWGLVKIVNEKRNHE